MKSRWKAFLRGGILRTVVRKTFTLMVLALLAAVLWDRFANTSGFVNARTYVFPVFSGIFLVAAWFCFLRMDGFSRMFSGKRRRSSGSQNWRDLVQTSLDNDEDLTDSQRAGSSMAACLLCGVLCLLVAVI